MTMTLKYRQTTMHDNDTPTGNPVRPTTKMALELGPVVAFLAAYVWLRERTFEIAGTEYAGFIVVTAAFVPLLALSTAILWRISGKMPRIQVVTMLLVLVLGGLTVWLNDPRVFKMKPTIVFGFFAAILGGGLVRGHSYLAWALDGALPLTDQGWRILTRRLALLFAALAVANELIWRLMSTDIWVASDTFGQPIAILIFFVFQGRLIETYRTDQASGP